VNRTATLGWVKHGYTHGTRRLATRSMTGLARTRVSPNALTAAGVSLCLAAAALIPFEHRNPWLYLWLAAALFGAGSILDILDGALARRSGKDSPFGAFLDSMSDRVGEAAVLAALAIVFAQDGNRIAIAFCFAALTGSFLVTYARAKAELLGFRGDVGLGSRAERVAVISAALTAGPWVPLQWFVYFLTAAAWLTVLQRILHIRRQLLSGGTDGFDRR
jgi:CDP-diacylglycerol--glycerol-3-phosphate 3-phosphatidyltransferase